MHCVSAYAGRVWVALAVVCRPPPSEIPISVRLIGAVATQFRHLFHQVSHISRVLASQQI